MRAQKKIKKLIKINKRIKSCHPIQKEVRSDNDCTCFIKVAKGREQVLNELCGYAKEICLQQAKHFEN